jgi:hypothetical protein
VTLEEKLMDLLKKQHLSWIQRATMNPELHMLLVSKLRCMSPEYRKLLALDVRDFLNILEKSGWQKPSH